MKRVVKKTAFYVTARSMYMLNLSQFHPSFPNFSQAVFVSFYPSERTIYTYPLTVYILLRGFVVGSKVDCRTPPNNTTSIRKLLVSRSEAEGEPG